MKEQWDNSPQLRQSIESELDNWGAWSRQGGRINLGHKSQIPGATPPERDPPRAVNIKLAEASERAISAWCATTEPGRRGAFLLKVRYVESLPVEGVAEHFRRKFKTGHADDAVAAMIDEAEMFYWMLTS